MRNTVILLALLVATGVMAQDKVVTKKLNDYVVTIKTADVEVKKSALVDNCTIKIYNAEGDNPKSRYHLEGLDADTNAVKQVTIAVQLLALPKEAQDAFIVYRDALIDYGELEL